MNDTQKAPREGRPGRTSSRCAWLVVLVIAGIVMTACTSPGQKALASRLHATAVQMDDKLYDTDLQLIHNMGQWNPTTIEESIADFNAMKDSWQRQSESATNEVRAAADKYTQGLSLHIKAYEAAALFARLGNVGVPKEAMKLLDDSGLPALDARRLLTSISG